MSKNEDFDALTAGVLARICSRSQALFGEPLVIHQTNNDDGIGVMSSTFHHVSRRKRFWRKQPLLTTTGVCGRLCQPWIDITIHDETIRRIVLEEIKAFSQAGVKVLS